ncbi:MAG TPA: trigger factor [Candidatus Saccharimonadales bacterium]|nr:trigger factor [Candidatus Saccharimonadales bacterium]
MQVTKKNLSDTKVQLTLAADAEQLAAAKQETLQHFAKDIKVQGFREGKAPLHMVEKHVAQPQLQADFLDRAMNRMYAQALDDETLRPVDQPQVKVTKFVPYDTLEIEAEVEVVGKVTLPDYKKIKLAKKKVTIEAKEIDDVIADLLTREAAKNDVERESRDGDQVWIDFKGVDAKTNEPVNGADGKDFPLTIGSNTFIPGFEPELIGLKAGEEKTFTITFPKDYGVSALQNRKVTFTVTVTKVQEVVPPKVDDAFAAKVGPFKTVADLKSDIKKELQMRKTQDADQAYADELILDITKKATVAVPEILVTEQIERLERDQRQNIMYRGQTWQEYLASEGLTEETYREKIRPDAELRVKAGLVLSEVAEAEGLQITAEELNQQMQVVASQYPDAKMQAELLKPEARRSIASRMLTEKTINRLAEYAQTK